MGGMTPEPASPEPTENDPTLPASSASLPEPAVGLPDFSKIEPPDLVPLPVPQPGFWGSILLIVLLVGAQVIVVLPSFLQVRDRRDLEAAMRAADLPATAAGFVASVILAFVMLQENTFRALAIRRIKPSHLLLVILLVPPAVLTELALASWVGELLPAAEEPEASPDEAASVPPAAGRTALAAARLTLSETARLMYGQMANRSWPVILVFFCLLPALGEELFFRGVLGRGLTARYGFFGMLLTSLLFGLQHLPADHMAATTLLGLIAQLVYLATGSLWGPIALHLGNNLLIFVADKGFANIESDLTGLSRFDATGIPSVVTAAGAAAVVLLLCLLFSMRTRWKLSNGTDWHPGYTTAEMPPRALAAVARSNHPSAGVMFLALVAYLAFAVTYGWYAFAAAPLASGTASAP